MTSPSRSAAAPAAPTAPTASAAAPSALRTAPRIPRRPASTRRRRPPLPSAVLVVLVLLGAAVTAFAGGLYGWSRPAQFAAHAFVLVAPTSGQTGDVSGTQLAAAFARVSNDPAVVGPALQQQNLPFHPRDIAGSVAAAASPDAPLIDVTGKAGNAGQSALVANTAAQALIDHVSALNATPGYRTVLLTPATVPDRPASSPTLVYGLLGGVLGLGLGAALVALRRT
jgi:capsular polysaccharide biosynthesis protein